MGKRLLQILFAAFLVGGTGFYVVPLFFSLPAELEKGPPRGLLFVDRNNQPIRRLLDGDLRAEDPASFDEFPKVLIDATVAVEDSRFFSHPGIDFIGIGRAVWDGIANQRFVSGASTVTQQTIKIYSPPRPRNLRTKVVEMFKARKLEMFSDKETILTAYFNKLPYGNQYTGARAAAHGYFGKPLGDLSAPEAAMLAGIPNKPTRFNPWRSREEAKARQLWVLKRMKEEGYLTEAEFTSSLIEALNFLPGPAQTFHAPHFVSLVESHEAGLVAGAKAKGTPIRTTLDLDLQHFVEATMTAELSRLSHEAGESNDIQAAAVIIENSTGDILALSGSRSFFGSLAGQMNGAWTPRSAGSTLKPFTYLMALEQGKTAASVIADTPIEYITSTGTYQPVNFDRRFHGPVSIRHALANSLNVPAVKLLNEIGGPTRLHELMQDHLHFSSLNTDVAEYGLGLTLGNAEVRLLELTNAYACLARLGEFRPYRFIQQGQAGDLTLPESETMQIFDQASTWLIADILSDTDARADAFGLSSPLNLPFRCAAKTGTSTDFRDNWTIGFTPDYTVGVWMGCFTNRPLKEISGAMGAAPIFHRLMVEVHRGQEPRWYEPPGSATQRQINPLNGHAAAADLARDRAHVEWFVNGHLPPPASKDDYSADGRTLLPLTYANWWRSNENKLKDVAALTPIAENESPPPFRILSPLDGTVAFLDPDLPEHGSRFPLRIAGSGEETIQWKSESLDIELEGDTFWVILRPGKHAIEALDAGTGRIATSTLVVEAL
ncbi:MAG: transglycosylase domain-containing protein [Verrucomicrobiales bacterium]|nr:transglycosylase domain-containing protein [Verrucomicrobiales bacterium]